MKHCESWHSDCANDSPPPAAWSRSPCANVPVRNKDGDGVRDGDLVYPLAAEPHGVAVKRRPPVLPALADVLQAFAMDRDHGLVGFGEGGHVLASLEHEGSPPARAFSSFFEYHIECFIGDRRLNSTQIETLDALAEFPVERVLELSART